MIPLPPRHARPAPFGEEGRVEEGAATLEVLGIGFAAGDIPKVPINLILLKSCQVVGVFYGSWSAKFRDEADANLKELLALYEQGKIKPLIGKRYPMEEYAAALRCLSERQAIGKVVVQIR